MKHLFALPLLLIILPIASFGFHGLVVVDPGDYADAIEDFLSGLGYDVTVTDTYPDASGMSDYGFVACAKGTLSGMASTFQTYLNNGGCVFLTSGQPWYMNMPDWIGMSTYSNWGGSNTYMRASYDNPLDAPGVSEGDPFYNRVNYMDGGAVLKNPTTATINGHFNNDYASAAQIHNEYGNGKVAWTAVWFCPGDAGDNGYTTDEYESYLEAVYNWFGPPGPGVEETTWGQIKAMD